MNEIIPSSQCDCNSSCAEPLVVNIPGSPGTPGLPGTNGTDGVNAFTTTTASYIQPAVSSMVNISVLDSSWAAVGEPIFIAVGGSYLVTAIIDGTTITVQNLGYAGNAAPTTVIVSTSVVTPSGIKGDNGSSSAGDMLRANNLSDVINVATSRSNLGLGSLAVLSSINNGNWSGTDLAITNGGTGASLAANALINLGGQPLDAILTALAALVTANNDMLYFTGADAPALLLTTAFGRSALTDADAASARLRLGKILPRYGLLGSVSALDLNAGAADTAFAIESTRYRIDRITVEGATINTTTATVGVFTAAGGAGTTVAADQSLASLTAGSKFHDLTLGGSVTADVIGTTTLYVRVGTAQSAVDTANLWLWGWKLD